jgi:hypothetical protein
MASKFWTTFNWGVLVVVTIFAGVVIWNSLITEESVGEIVHDIEIPCVEVMSGFEYGACYDAYLETIFLKVKRGNDRYTINSLEVSFLDLSNKFYYLRDVPEVGKEKAYRISADKNPRNIKLDANIIKDFIEPICEDSNEIFIDYCPVGTSGVGVDVSISPIGGIEIKDFIEIEDSPDLDSDILTKELVSSGKIWDSLCEPIWECGEWESCVNKISRRDCEDIKKCIVSKDAPITVKGCDGECIEDWECEWGGCNNGASTPDCKDLNNCGTRYDIPEELPCEKIGKCVPEIECDQWSACEVDYDFIDLIGDGSVDLQGLKSRTCVDNNKCVYPQKELEKCSVSVDIYTENFEKCGEEYIGVYDSLDSELLAILERGVGANKYLNIYFSEKQDIMCSYCFDGVVNGDEDDIDCGGSCGSCDGYKITVYKESFWDWFRGLFS